MIPKEESQKLKESLLLPVALVALMFVIHLIKNYSDLNFIYWGIFPRKPHGLIGILTAPLVHGNWRHLFSNAIPFLSLMTMCLYFYRVVALRGIAMIWILTGASVWLLGNFFDDEMKNVSHIGASGVVYGLVAFIFWNGIFVKSS
ncbi:MAG TPA: rhomboid family intramembrane serine protease, partial [Phaeodactylibacter sp.]|nr:rhomboid family intramembrane serine protease [Phaeodactylibacter sp.]